MTQQLALDLAPGSVGSHAADLDGGSLSVRERPDGGDPNLLHVFTPRDGHPMRCAVCFHWPTDRRHGGTGGAA